MKQEDGGPAFPGQLGAYGRGNDVPVLTDNGVEYVAVTTGMTLRDYFAGQALMGHCANPAGIEVQWSKIAHSSYDAADAMLLERVKEIESAKANDGDRT